MHERDDVDDLADSQNGLYKIEKRIFNYFRISIILGIILFVFRNNLHIISNYVG